MNIDNLITVAQFAKLHNISHQRVYQLLNKNKISSHKIAGRLLIDKDAVIVRTKSGNPRLQRVTPVAA